MRFIEPNSSVAPISWLRSMTSDTLIQLVNGKPGSSIAITDRGLSYGDGVFETMLCVNRRVPLMQRHLERLEQACNVFGFTPCRTEWERDVEAVLAQSEAGKRYVVKLVLTRGSGGLGYTPGNNEPTRITQRLVYPQTGNEREIECAILDTRLGSNRQLAGHKHLNRLEQVMAAREASERGVQEGLVCDEYGFLVEAVSSNVLLVFDDRVVTPPIENSGVKGIMRDLLIEKTQNSATPVTEELVFCDAIDQADEIILCNSVRGVRRVSKLGEKVLQKQDVYLNLGRIAEQALETAS